MDTTDGALLPVHVRIFQGLVPQVASQATSLENILRTLCQKIETLESCLASINSGVVEMDMRLKIIAHNIEGGTNDEAFNAASTFMPSLASPLPATKPSKSAVVSHVMSALAMGHVAKPLEKPKKRRKKPPPALSSPAGLVTSIPTAELSAGPTEKPPTLNRGHSSARLLRDSPRSRYIPDQRDVPHTARSKANVHAVDKIHTPTADGSDVPSIQLERRRPSHPEPPPSPPPDDAAAVHTIPRLPLSLLVVENSAGKSTQTTPSVAKPHANSMQAAAAPFAAERQTLLANAQP
ncbi:hypothetical protein DYB34_009716, partial [Aphanomyces astaci]